MGKSANPAKAAEQEQAEAIEYDPTPVDSDGVEDFDAFWSTVDRPGKPVRIMGEVVTLPPAMPLEFDLLAKRIAKSTTEADMRRLVGILFGADALDRWTKAGMDADQFKVVLAWAPQRISGGTMSMAEVAAKIAEAEAAQVGEA